MMIAVSMAKLTQVAFISTGSNSITIQAQQFALSEAEMVRKVAYDNLTNLDDGRKHDILSTSFKKEIGVNSENDYTDTIKERLVVIKVYNGDEENPRAMILLPRYSSEEKPSGVPVGTIIAWASANAPSGGTWLECNGQSCAAYPELAAVLGKNTVPDYRGRFLEGAATAGTVKEAGLPNITGSFGYLRLWIGYSYEVAGAFFDNGITKNHDDGNNWTTGRGVGFDASRSSAIYGNSDTVQPPSVTVRYLIKAA